MNQRNTVKTGIAYSLDNLPMLTARFAAMMWLVTLSADDLENAERACRSLAATYHRDAERHQNPIARDAALESAKTFERMSYSTSGIRSERSNLTTARILFSICR